MPAPVENEYNFQLMIIYLSVIY